MELEFKTALIGCDDEGKEFCKHHEKEIKQIMFELEPLWIGFLRTQFRAQGLVLPEIDFADSEIK